MSGDTGYILFSILRSVFDGNLMSNEDKYFLPTAIHIWGMLPLKADAAEGQYAAGNMLIYALHPDGTESVIGNEKQFQRHKQNGGLFAVDKEDWMKYLENGEFLLTTEISTEQNYNMIDGRRNNIEPQKISAWQTERETGISACEQKKGCTGKEQRKRYNLT